MSDIQAASPRIIRNLEICPDIHKTAREISALRKEHRLPNASVTKILNEAMKRGMVEVVAESQQISDGIPSFSAPPTKRQVINFVHTILVKSITENPQL